MEPKDTLSLKRVSGAQASRSVLEPTTATAASHHELPARGPGALSQMLLLYVRTDQPILPIDQPDAS